MTFCEDCDHVHPATRNASPSQWRCMKAPSEQGYGFVSRGYSPDPPYSRCKYVNPKGECTLFEKRREAREASHVQA